MREHRETSPSFTCNVKLAACQEGRQHQPTPACCCPIKQLLAEEARPTFADKASNYA